MPEQTTENVENYMVEDLDRLYLIAQFFSSNTSEAAALVRKATESDPHASFADRVTRLVSLAGFKSEENNAPGDLDLRISPPIPDNRGEAFLAERLALVFFSLSPQDRLRLWNSVRAVKSGETNSLGGTDISQDPLEHFSGLLQRSCSDLETIVYAEWLGTETVIKGLRHFWESTFEPVPPTLYSSVPRRTGRHGASDGSSEGSSERPVRSKSKFARVMLYGVLIVTAAFLGYTFTGPAGPEPTDATSSVDLIDYAIDSAEDVAASLQTESTEQAERFIRDRFHREVNIPVITGYRMDGIGIQNVADSASIPVLLFASDDKETRAFLFVWSYALLLPDDATVSVTRATLNQIENPDGVDIRESTPRSAVVWRDSDDIFVGITTEDPQNFAGLLVRQ